MKKHRIITLIITLGFFSILNIQGKEFHKEFLMPINVNDNAFNKERYIKIAKDKFNIEIDDIYFGHNKTGITAVIINTKNELSNEQLKEKQENINAIFSEYSRAIINLIYKRKNKPYAIVQAKKTYSKEDSWIVVYRYESAMTILKEKANEFQVEFSKMEKFKGHEIFGFYYALSSFPLNESHFPSTIVCITKNENGEYFRFNFAGNRAGDLWSYQYDEEKNKFYSTGVRSDPQIQVVLENEDMVNINLYYFEEDDERYGTYHFKIKN